MRDKVFIEQRVLRAPVDPSATLPVHGEGMGGADRLLVNGSCFVKDGEAIEPEFHRLMFVPVGA